jgi:cob(I)alamin adenosyltransferase
MSREAPATSGDRRPAIETSVVATGKGDDGTTGLLYGGPRIGKDDPRTEAFGTVDEAVAALGVARAALAVSVPTATDAPRSPSEQPFDAAELADLILRFQRELFVVGAELATTPDAWARLEDGRTRVSEAMLDGVEASLADLEARITMPTEFVVPGETPASAALELARTILRRAERRATTLDREHLVPGPWLLPYMNRLADLVWVMARAAEAAESALPRPSVQGGRRGARTPA